MKKLLFITYSLGKSGGVQTVLTNLMNELCTQFDITVLCLDGNEEFIYDLNSKIKTVVLNSFGNTKSYRSMVFINQYFSWLPKKQNIKNYIYQYGVYCLLKKWLKKNHQNYDTLISCRYTLSSMLSTMKGINKKTWTWEHINYKMGGFFWYTIMRPYYKYLKGIIYINKESEEHYKKINPNSFLIYNIIGDPFESMPFISCEDKENTILFVGRLHPEKNIREIVEIYSNLKNKESWKLKIIGDGPEKNYLENYIQENPHSNIEIEGNKTKEEVCDYMKKSKILVLASETEAFGLVLVESMFCSNVLVSYNCEFGPSHIVNENNGFLIKHHDKEDFTNKLQLLINNEALLKKINKSSYDESKKWKKDNILTKWELLLVR
ncbi:Glycosyltransferase involved in cell wall bisynthesis [Apibacter mensalis]|uniref:Glycosyltransferase involved in cell wall bisynthesis n=1 Tax=Apibacter mensalis TaxID=1586267 RepID=A0A0X3APS4_9FLAO|nr:glycosyltransferase [Apibacter mensalis]CVK16362.1 Glycosyltransferase involved in cell wall bisynthesis [Apibacter mensalis]